MIVIGSKVDHNLEPLWYHCLQRSDQQVTLAAEAVAVGKRLAKRAAAGVPAGKVGAEGAAEVLYAAHLKSATKSDNWLLLNV